MVLPGMPHLSANLILIILRFLKENGYNEAAHELERESGLYFNWIYFEELLLNGKWDEAEKYLSGFTQLDDNIFSKRIYFELRKQKYLEALDRNDKMKALEILTSDLKVFEAHKDLFEALTKLLTWENNRTDNKLAANENTQNARSALRWEIKKNVAMNPALREKLILHGYGPYRLERLMNQSLNWQHTICAYPVPNPVMHTLFTDHRCKPPENPLSPPAHYALKFSQAIPVSISSPTGGPSSSSTVLSASKPRATVCLSHAANSVEYSNYKKNLHSAEKILGGPAGTHNLRTRGFNTALQEVTSMNAYPDLIQQPTPQLLDYLPMKVIQTLKDELYPTGIDFHPIQHTYLLVGTANGGVGLWEVGSGVKLFFENFKVWNMEACSTKFKGAMTGSSSISINRVIWSSDGSLLGAAFSRHLVQIYVFGGGNVVKPHLEIEAHDGSVNDLAFSATDKQQFVITCGDDGMVKVWDVKDGVKQFTFEGHKAPVYSVLPHKKSGLHFIFSTSVDGQIRAWSYGDFGARIYYDAPGPGCIVMAYSNDDKRLFACGTKIDGESFLVEWDEDEGFIKRTYQGMGKCSSGIAHFHIAKSVLAAGDEHVIKFWSMDDVKLLATTDAEGGLPAKPHLCFNKEGSLLAVIADGHGIKILAPKITSRLLKTSESCSFIDASRTSEALRKEC